MPKLSRRKFLNIAAAASAASISPFGAFFASPARATVPIGPHLRRYGDNQFWFKKLRTAAITANPASAESLASDGGQLTLRLGLSGGFATGYFSTLSFLSSYKAQSPDDFQDLLFGIALLPKDDFRRKGALAILEQHRRFKLQALPKGQILASTASLTAGAVTEQAPLKELLSVPKLFSSLEDLAPPQIMAAASAAVRQVQPETNSPDTLKLASTAPIIGWDPASSLVQDLISQEFSELNPELEFDPAPMNTNRLLTFEEGALKLAWIDWQLLQPAFADGVDDGRLSALGYIALAETAANLKTNQIDINQALKHYDAASRLVEAFQDDLFFQSGTAAGAFKSSIRMRNISYVRMPSGELRTVNFQTPFLPFEYTRTVNEAEEREILAASQSNLIVAQRLNTIEALTQDPKSTVALIDAAIPACKSVMRDTLRTLAAASGKMPELRDAKLESVVLVPEMTSSWIFTGMGAALCHTHLVHLADTSLSTQEERLKFKRSILASVGLIARQALPNGDMQASSFSPVNPALVQYADGYRVANLLGDRVSDVTAQSEGARKVYVSLQSALPEFFQDLPADKLLTADQIAQAVGVIATTVHETIETLRLQVTQLTAALKDMQDFVISLKGLIEGLQGNLSSVQNMDALRGFQTNASRLIQEKLASTTDAVKLQTLASLQGLVNTIVSVGVNIENNLQVSAKANAGYCGVGINK